MRIFTLAAAVTFSLGGAGLLAAVPATSPSADDMPWPATPPQDQGLPYTRSAREFALKKLANHIAVFAGSRYGYVNGHKVRLDPSVLRGAEAAVKDGGILVPSAFAAVLDLKEPAFDKTPDYLADRWVSTITNLPSADLKHEMVALADVAKGHGLKVYQNPRGLLVIGQDEINFTNAETPLLESVIALFDTPEKLADPDIAARYLPSLIRQGVWTEHVKVTPEQLAVLNGPETKWPTADKSQYDYTGFNQKLLGSKVPPPGVYPRILFSPEDVPMLAERIRGSKVGQKSLIEIDYLLKKSWWDSTTSDGQLFDKLASGDTKDLQWDVPPETAPNSYPGLFKGEKPGIYNSHIQYVPECLTNMALYCLITGDDEHGKKAASAIVNYYKLREPLLDEAASISDSEYSGSWIKPDGTVVPMHGSGAQTHWRTVAGVVAHMNLGLSLDFSGKWMDAEQKETMRRIIAKATYGRRAYGQDGPVRFRDVNWVAWDLPQFLALEAIEGLEGFDPEVFESSADTIRGFCDWGIDENGVIYESNGKTPGGLQFETLSMIALARRGENLWGHPHWRKLMTGQVQMTSPSGWVVVNSGTQYSPFSRAWFSQQFTDEYKAFFPNQKLSDYLLTRCKLFSADDEGMREWQVDNFDADHFKQQVAKVLRMRMPSPTYPGFVHSFLYDSDWTPTTREDLKLPLSFDDPVHGVFSAYSDRSTQAAWLNMMVRPDHYLGAGHHHADQGMVHFSALGVDWFTQSPFSGQFQGKYFNLVQVDGHSEAEAIEGFGTCYSAPGKYLGAKVTDDGSVAQADLTNCYSYRWVGQPGQYWPSFSSQMGLELDPSEANLKMWAGTARYKMRPWWPYYTYSNYIPTSRAPWNPMQYVYRTAGLVRGAHPYGFVVDDLKKDEQSHLYQWVAMLNGGVWRADVQGLSANQMALAYREPDHKAKVDPKAMPKLGADSKPAVAPAAGEPLLLVTVVGLKPSTGDEPTIQVTTEAGPHDPKLTIPSAFDRIAINHRGDDVNFKVILLPIHAGEPLPTVQYDAHSNTATVAWKDQSDQIAFTNEPAGSTQVAVTRDGKTLVSSR